MSDNNIRRLEAFLFGAYMQPLSHFSLLTNCPSLIHSSFYPSGTRDEGGQTRNRCVCRGGALHVIRSLYCGHFFWYTQQEASSGRATNSFLFFLFLSFLNTASDSVTSSPLLLLHTHNTQHSTTNRKENIQLQPWSSCQTSEEAPRQTGPPSSNSLRRTRCERCLSRPSAMLSP